MSQAARQLDPTDTIVAISSPPGPGLRGLVRLSGPRAWEVAREGFAAHKRCSPPTRPELRSGSLEVAGLTRPLPASLAFWPAPRTYTGEPLAELHTVGSPPLLGLVLAHYLARGARTATPGEFTLRAFLSGRIDLTRAEAVLGVIEARSPAQLDAALRQLAGGLATPITRLRDRLLDLLAHLEATLDFVEEPDVDPLGRAALAEELVQAAAEVDTLAERLRGRDRPEGRPRVVLIGPPNTGKSSLFNALLGGPQALVSPQAGTTRDYLSAPCDCAGLAIELLDTAGIEPALSPISHRAQDLRAEQAAAADLLIDCLSADTAEWNTANLPDQPPRLRAWTKADLAPPPTPSAHLILTSAHTGLGLDDLRRAISSVLLAQTCSVDAPSGTSDRCRQALARAGQALRSAAQPLALAGGDELVAIDLRQAVDDLGHVVGAVVTDDILDRIFHRFCIGK